MGDVHLDHIGGAQRGETVEVGEGIEPLAGGNRYVCLPLDLGQQIQAVRRDRFLAPGRREGLECGSSPGRCRPQSPMKLDHQAHPGSHRLAYGGDHSDRELALLGRRVFPDGAKRVELHPAVAARDHVPRPVGVLSGGARAAVPPVGVGRDAPVAAPPRSR